MASDLTRSPLPTVSRPDGSAIADRAYRQIRDAIASLVLQPGQPLTEASLAAWLQVGRTPVREALLRLKDEGLVESVPRKGYFVSRISAHEAREIYEMLEGLEGVASRLAAERRTPEGIARLEKAVDAMEAAIEADDLDAWAAADDAAHEAILEMAGNQQIKRAVRSLQVRIKRLQLFTVRKRSKLAHSAQVHRAQLEAIRAGDGKAARAMRQDLWIDVADEIVDIVRRRGGSDPLL